MTYLGMTSVMLFFFFFTSLEQVNLTCSFLSSEFRLGRNAYYITCTIILSMSDTIQNHNPKPYCLYLQTLKHFVFSCSYTVTKAA